ncbi:hypothetical protein VE04_02953 [Pseudogymnoascus sp. 24MN13]|nr:hypothetical protein VE04_02953 [Pseudogymnoascus sp. 24MN13]
MKLSDVLFGAILCISAPVRGEWTVGQGVYTQSGLVLGSAASKLPSVSVYRGIPYAQPPIGELRFAAPLPFSGNTLLPFSDSPSIDGTKFGASCPVSSYFAGKPVTKGKGLSAAGLATLAQLTKGNNDTSEDCLTLNVWTKPQTGEKKKAVVIWVHGKGYTTGSSSDPVYDGQFIVNEQDIILVTFNYRMNIFGFPGSYLNTRNIGLLDQRLAVEWVRDNIAGFGGDPARITLIGDSAGAGLVDLYSFAYVDDPIISGMGLLSGTTSLSGWDPDSLPKAERDWNSVTCDICRMGTETDFGKVIACMRNKTTAEITAAIPITTNPYGSKSFFPNNDGKTVFSDYYELARTGKFIKVPLLIGNTDDETAYHRIMADVFAPSYGYGQTNYDNERRNYFTCPASERARHTADLGVPTWRYGYFGDFKDARLTTAAHARAYHGSDVLLIFGTELVPGVKQDADELKLAKYARGALAAFARNPKTGLKTYGWPQYNPKTKSLVQLGKDNKVGAFAVTPAAFDTGCLY